MHCLEEVGSPAIFQQCVKFLRTRGRFFPTRSGRADDILPLDVVIALLVALLVLGWLALCRRFSSLA